jgi:hypothetical protein
MLRLAVLISFAAVLLIPPTIFAENKPPMLTNDDLIKYKKDSDNSPYQHHPRQSIAPTEDSRNEEAYGAWCDAGTQYRNRVERAKKEMEEAEEKFRIEKHEHEVYKMYKGKLGRSSSYISAENRLSYARKNLEAAELDLSDLESQAHRKGVKPGWLRCQK